MNEDIVRLMAACDYAARQHADQRRKGAACEPYVNHVIEVAARVASSPDADADTVIAALLHDVVEDTDGTAADIAALFGARVAGIVLEVTDDKTLAKSVRKARQVETVRAKSDAALRIKLADKAANLAALAHSPPAHWNAARKSAYLDWAEAVISGCRALDPVLEAGFDREASRLRQCL
ncbi:MAG: HD domain-containing protein [Pseudorhodobacter sp.]